MIRTDALTPATRLLARERLQGTGGEVIQRFSPEEVLVPANSPDRSTLRGALGDLGRNAVKLVGGVLGAAVASTGGLAGVALYGTLGLGVGAVFGALGGIIGGVTGEGCYVDKYAFCPIGSLAHKRVAEKTGSHFLGALVGIPAGIVGDGVKGAVDLSRILVANELRQVGRFLVGVSEMLAG